MDKKNQVQVARLVAPYAQTIQLFASYMTAGIDFDPSTAEMERQRIYPFLANTLTLGFTVGLLLGKEDECGRC